MTPSDMTCGREAAVRERVIQNWQLTLMYRGINSSLLHCGVIGVGEFDLATRLLFLGRNIVLRTTTIIYVPDTSFTFLRHIFTVFKNLTHTFLANFEQPIAIHELPLHFFTATAGITEGSSCINAEVSGGGGGECESHPSISKR